MTGWAWAARSRIVAALPRWTGWRARLVGTADVSVTEDVMVKRIVLAVLLIGGFVGAVAIGTAQPASACDYTQSHTT